MKILFLSRAGDGADIALRMKLQGNDVKLWIEETRYDDTFEGLIEKVFAWKPWVPWCDLVVFDQNSKTLAAIHESIGSAKPMFGGSAFGLKLEKDRKFGRKIMNEIGFEPLESIEFKTVADVVKHLKGHKVRHVVKPSGAKIQSHHVIIGEQEDSEDVIALLEAFEGQNIPFDYIEVEERKLGIEIGCGAFSAGKGGLTGIDINFEHKHSATGQLGFLTGETGTIIKAVSDSNKFFRDTLAKAAAILKKENYIGQIDINCILDPKSGKIFCLEWTPRLGYPAIFIQCENQDLPWADLFMMCARQMSFDNLVSNDWCIGAVYMTPGFPSDDEVKKRSFEYPIFGSPAAMLGKKDESEKSLALSGVHLLEAKILKSRLVTAKGNGMPFVVTAKGETIQKAQKALYGLLNEDDLMKRPRVPSGWFRTDIGDRVIAQLPDLERLGIFDEKEAPAQA